MILAMALLSDGGYSLSCAVLNCGLCCWLFAPIVKGVVVVSGLWHVGCRL